MSAFDLFWEVYPRKAGKEPARKAWKKLNPTNGMVEAIVENVKTRSKDDPQWTEEDGRFIPYPATYLNQRRWEDETQAKTDMWAAFDAKYGKGGKDGLDGVS